MIPIPEYFKIYNLAKQSPNNIYTSFFAKLEHEKVSLDECSYCGACIDYCTQKIDIPKMFEKAHEELSDGFNPYD